MRELYIDELQIVSGGEFEFGRDYITLGTMGAVTATSSTMLGSARAASMTGSAEAIAARSTVSAMRGGVVMIPMVAYNATVFVNRNTPVQDWIARGMDWATGLDQSGNNYDIHMDGNNYGN